MIVSKIIKFEKVEFPIYIDEKQQDKRVMGVWGFRITFQVEGYGDYNGELLFKPTTIEKQIKIEYFKPDRLSFKKVNNLQFPMENKKESKELSEKFSNRTADIAEEIVREYRFKILYELPTFPEPEEYEDIMEFYGANH